MIQEIYDYLWIRNYIPSNTTEAIIEALQIEKDNNHNTSYVDIVNALAYLIEREHFLLIDDDFVSKISTIINEFRFDYNKDKVLNEKINYIIERLNDYSKMSDSRKRYLIKDFYKKEIKDRCLSHRSNRMTIDSCILVDCFGYVSAFFETSEKLSIDDLFGFISTINLIISRYPEFFDSEDKKLIVYNIIKESMEAIVNLSKKDRKNHVCKSTLDYAKKTLIRLHKLELDKNKVKIKD